MVCGTWWSYKWTVKVKAETPHSTYREDRMCCILVNSVWQREAIHRRKRRFLASVRYSLKIYLGFTPFPHSCRPTQPPHTHINTKFNGVQGWRTAWDPRREGLYWLSLDLLKQLSLSGRMWSSPSAVMVGCSCHTVNSFHFLILLSSSLSVRRAGERCFGYQAGKAFWAVAWESVYRLWNPVNFILMVGSNVQGAVMLWEVI